MATYNEVWNTRNVESFRGFTVEKGQVAVSSDEYCDFLDEVYDTVTVCGFEYLAGAVLEAIDPVAFRCSWGDYESELQSELESALENEDASDIEWLEFDPSEIEGDE